MERHALEFKSRIERWLSCRHSSLAMAWPIVFGFSAELGKVIIMKISDLQRLASSFSPGLGAAGTLFALAGIFHPGTSLGQNSIELKIQIVGSQIEIVWPDKWTAPTGQIQYPVFAVERTVDLKNWQSLGQKLQGSSGSDGQLKAVYDLPGPMAYYRVVGNPPAGTVSALGAGGGEVFGYATQFAVELQRIGQITPTELASRYALTNEYLPGISWDPTTAQFWDQFRTNANFALDAGELALFKKNGFVVSQRLGAYSFAELYYRIYKADLPVFVSADALLQAWHRSYDSMLMELEATWFYQSVESMLTEMRARIPAAWAQFGDGPLHESLLDVDYFLTVGQSLLAGTNVTSALGQDARVTATLAAIRNERLVSCYNLFNDQRDMDFSQFKVRGHYEFTAMLGRYFQTMMWLGRIDFRVAGGPFDDGCGSHKAPPRELGSAIVLHHLLTQAGQFDRWQQMDKALQVFVGWTDSMTVAQLGDLLNAANIKSLADITSVATLEKLQADLEQGQYGFQNIRSDFFVSPLGSEQMKLPRSFTFMGQRFVLDSWALSQLVFDSILWDNQKVMRRIPSALDVAFSVLGNDQIVPELVARMTNSNGRQFRDGLPYQHNLAAVRSVVDKQQAPVWEDSIYTQWLSALRELSAPTTAGQYPEAMRTRDWAMKSLNTQLASWTELRHDTILYAKPSYTGYLICYYPAGFVEPSPGLWRRLQNMAQRTAELIGTLDYQGSMSIQEQYSMPRTVQLAGIKAQQTAFLRKFSDTMAVLKGIAEKEMAQQPLTATETTFLENVIQSGGRFGSGGQMTYDGWYPQLFYRSVLNSADQNDVTFHQNAGSGKWDALVADVHTDPPCPDCGGDPGSVLHEAVGNADLLMIAVDNGADRMVYAGPVLSHYEFEILGSPTRKSDTEWKDDYRNSKWPSPPEWTRGYLVPGRPSGSPPFEF